jgi:DNA polymerase-3 subunit beta
MTDVETQAEAKPRRRNRAAGGAANGTVEGSPDQQLNKITLPAGTLSAVLKDVVGAVEARSTVPVLSHVLLQADLGVLHLTGTDLDLWVTRELACDAQAARFALCVPAAPLAKLLGKIEADCEITLEVVEQRLVVKAGRSRFVFHALPAADFPEAPAFAAAHVMDLPCAALADPMANVRHAISTEETRYYLNGVFLHVEAGALRFAATDGHRLARYEAVLPEGAEAWPDQIVPRHAVALLGKLLSAAVKTGSQEDPARVLFECAGAGVEAKLRWTMPAADGSDVMLVAKSIDGTFPDYRRVIPVDLPLFATVGKGALASAVRRVAVMAVRSSRMVSLEFSSGNVTVLVNSPELGEARGEIGCIYEGPNVRFGVNADYLLAALAVVATDELRIGFTEDGLAPLLIAAPSSDGQDPRLVQVLMPMRGGA